MIRLRNCVLALALAATLSASGQEHVLDVRTNKAGAEVAQTMYGLFFEDINFAADGGLYGELVKNRSFEFPQTLMGWRAFGKVAIKTDGPFERCPHYVVLSNPGHRERRTGLQNEGYFGIGIEQGKSYRFSVWAKAPEGHSQIRVQLIDEHTMAPRQEFAEQRLDVEGTQWKKYELVLKADRTVARAQLRIFLSDAKPVALEHISLFPTDTYKNRPNGLRRDLAQALADIHPGVFRFPGGCIVEGTTLDSRYQWKNSVGPVENRPLNRNRWEDTFDFRYFADYYQSYGLGFFEFFQLCEDIGAEPLPVLSVGLACQYQNDLDAHAPIDSLQPYIDDCLDLIEFANGPATSTWGKVRADMGHPEPFHLKFIAIGNEQWDEPYFQRLRPFVEAIRKQYPDIQIVGSSGPNSEDKRFHRGWKAMKAQQVDLVDEHFYRPESWFLGTAEGKAKYGNCGAMRYDSYDRRGPKVFAGEYACHETGKKWNHYEASICEAAFMTGMERNADVVRMATYAPLFAHVDGWQWRPDLIWYDNLRMFRSVSYYVQQLFATNRGTHVLPLTMAGQPVAGQDGQDGLFASAVLDKPAGDVVVKVVNTAREPRQLVLNLIGMKGQHAVATLTLHHQGAMTDENTLDCPDRIVPVAGTTQTTADKKQSRLADTLPPMSMRVYRIASQK